jgi:hypothetical protein
MVNASDLIVASEPAEVAAVVKEGNQDVDSASRSVAAEAGGGQVFMRTDYMDGVANDGQLQAPGSRIVPGSVVASSHTEAGGDDLNVSAIERIEEPELSASLGPGRMNSNRVSAATSAGDEVIVTDLLDSNMAVPPPPRALVAAATFAESSFADSSNGDPEGDTVLEVVPATFAPAPSSEATPQLAGTGRRYSLISLEGSGRRTSTTKVLALRLQQEHNRNGGFGGHNSDADEELVAALQRQASVNPENIFGQPDLKRQALLEIFSEEIRSRNAISPCKRTRGKAFPLDDMALGNHSLSLDDITLGKRLGDGAYGVVCLAETRRTGFVFALKVVSKQQLIQGRLEHQLLREIDIQSSCQHVNTLRLYNFFHDENSVYLMLEMAPGGSLYKLLEKLKRFSEPRSASYFKQIVEAIRYCHSKHIIHRDLKPDNILIGLNDTLKIADFGWSVHAPASSRRTTVCGTLDYLPPEMCDKNNKRGYHSKVDVWSLGVILYEFLAGVGETPFYDESSPGTKNNIMSKPLEFPLEFPSGAQNLVSGLLKKEPSERLPLEQVLEDPWLTSYCEGIVSEAAIATSDITCKKIDRALEQALAPQS